jgi:DNA-binding PadR family transcriptional regulator
MHKELLILGLAGSRGPISGYDIHRIVRAHGDFFTDLKKPNMYYLLGRLAESGYLRVRAEPGTRGRRGERLLYKLTPKGRQRFHELLRVQLQRYDTVHTGIEVAVIFLSQLSQKSALALMKKRRAVVEKHQRTATQALGDISKRGTLAKISADHLLMLINAEVEWLKGAITTLEHARDSFLKQP